MKSLNLLAMDFGASNGRGVLGKFDGNKIALEELHRFSNDYIWVNGLLYWDTLYLYNQIVASLGAFSAKYGKELDGVGIDTWGVDYGLIDKNGQICGMPISYRNSDDQTMEHFEQNVMSRRELFNRTGIARNNFNTVYQLHGRMMRKDSALETADKLLLLPDLFSYMLSGEMGSEYTMASTSQLCNPATRDWDYELIEKMGLAKDLFVPVTKAGTKRGNLLPQIAQAVGLNQLPVLAVGGHDTSSAVAAVPAKGEAVFLSSGTWSLLGMESDNPIITDQVFKANYSNEGNVQGNFRPLKNIMGLWVIQQLRREWTRAGKKYSWDEIVELAKQAKPFVSIIDSDDQSFFAADQMEAAIRQYCERTGQPKPETPGEFAVCVYQSLAIKYKWTVVQMEGIRGKKVETLNIVGGGGQNRLLSQMTANALGIPVTTGPTEGASIGNLLMQAMALGEISGMDQLRQVVRNSFEVEEYLPKDTRIWQDAYGRFLEIIKLQ